MARSTSNGYDDTAFGRPISDRAIGWTIAAGVGAIAFVTAVVILVMPDFGPGLRLEPPAYALIGLCVSALFVTFASSSMRNEFRAGVCLIAYWAFSILAMCAIFQYAR